MTGYRIKLYENNGERVPLFFDCQADDEDHAVEQAEDAYPGCVVVLVTTRVDA